ncbi:MAG: flagellar motor switch protein FliM [Candidatus Eisenbacteria sp.]|nr:flagellar motor switch protein FliM [Candidatus Eisenbacteria bacterium]
MANILSQDEVDALLSSFADEGDGAEEAESPEPTPEETKSESKISVYDFRRPNRISKDQLRFLEVLHEGFVARFTGVLSGYMRTMVEIEILSVEQLTYGEWVQSLPESTCVFPFSMEPLQGSGAVETSPSFGLSLVDRLLGGQGAAVDRSRDLTPLETGILARIADQQIRGLAEIWSDMMVFTPKIEGFEKQPNMLKLLPDPETVVLITFEIKTQTLNGTISICYPFVALEPALTRASAGAFGANAIRPVKVPDGPAWITKGLKRGRVDVTAKLGTGMVTVGEFIRLRPGDVVRLETRVDHPAEVIVGDRPMFHARAGQAGRKLAVQIVGRMDEDGGQMRGETDGT